MSGPGCDFRARLEEEYRQLKSTVSIPSFFDKFLSIAIEGPYREDLLWIRNNPHRTFRARHYDDGYNAATSCWPSRESMDKVETLANRFIGELHHEIHWECQLGLESHLIFQDGNFEPKVYCLARPDALFVSSLGSEGKLRHLACRGGCKFVARHVTIEPYGPTIRYDNPLSAVEARDRRQCRMCRYVEADYDADRREAWHLARRPVADLKKQYDETQRMRLKQLKNLTRQEVLKTACRTCSAQIDDSCTTRSGKPTLPHQSRFEDVRSHVYELLKDDYEFWQ